MKVNKTEIIEAIKKLNKEKHLTEGTDIQRNALPADADALEQHQEALKQNAERRDPKNYAKEVKEVIEETASEESRYRHFDVVDRKDLAKKINEAKEKGLDFKVSRSTKEGFRYDLKVLNEDFIKKEAGDPEVNAQAFNKAANVGASSPTTGLGEDMEEETSEQCSVCDSIKFLIDDEKEAIDGYKKADECLKSLADETLKVKISSLYNHIIGEELEHIRELQDMLAEVDPTCAEELSIELHGQPTDDIESSDINKDKLDEELKVYTSSLSNFHPSERSKDLWNEIKDAHKEEDLEYALETIYPDGISDVALDDMLCYEEDWIRDLIDLPVQDGEKDDEDTEVVDEFEDEDIEPVDFEHPEDDIPDDTEAEPVTDEEPVDDEVEDTTEAETSSEDEKEEDKEEEDEEEEEDLKEDKSTEPTDSELDNLAEAFFKKNFKPNTLNLTEGEDTKQEQQAEAVKQSVATTDDEEVVAVDDELVENMLGLTPSK